MKTTSLSLEDLLLLHPRLLLCVCQRIFHWYMRIIFKYPTVRELAALVDDDGVTEAAQSKNEFSDYNYNRTRM